MPMDIRMQWQKTQFLKLIWSTPSEDLWILMLDSAKYKRNKLRDGPEMGGGNFPP